MYEARAEARIFKGGGGGTLQEFLWWCADQYLFSRPEYSNLLSTSQISGVDRYFSVPLISL